MKVRVEKEKGCRRVLHVQATADEVLPDYESVVRAVAKSAKVKGFRPGRAPVGLVERQYAKPVAEEARERLLPRLYRQALDQESIEAIAPVQVRDVTFQKETGMSFAVTIDVPPTFKLPKYKKISLKSQSVAIDDDKVEGAVQRLLERHSRFEDVDGRVVQAGDLVSLDYEGTCAGAPLKTLASAHHGLCEGRDFWVLLDQPEFIPGFNAGLSGCAPGETRTITVVFPEDYRIDEVAGKTAEYSVTVKAIRERVLPTLDETLFKRLEVASEAELRDKIRQELSTAAQREETQRLKNDVSRHLLEKTECDLPQSLVEEETHRIGRSMLEEMAQRGAAGPDIEKRKSEIAASAARAAEERVKLTTILRQIAREEGLAVQEAEMDQRLQDMSRQYGVARDKIQAAMENNNGLERMKQEMLCEKTLDFLLEHAKIKP